MKNLKYTFTIIFVFVCNILVFSAEVSTWDSDQDSDTELNGGSSSGGGSSHHRGGAPADGGVGGVGPGAPPINVNVPGNQPPEAEGTRARHTPIDMYERMLIIAAVMLIIGYYYTNNKRKAVNS